METIEMTLIELYKERFKTEPSANMEIFCDDETIYYWATLVDGTRRVRVRIEENQEEETWD